MIPRVRMFAGPNGSGKSTLKKLIPPNLVGVYVNADEIEQEIRESGRLNLDPFPFSIVESELQCFFVQSKLLEKAGLDVTNQWHLSGTELVFAPETINSYFAAVLADFIRRKLLKSGVSFTFETVMSSFDKIEFLKEAQNAGFRTYLYFVATSDPEINWARIQNRIEKGGHSVPHDKVFDRYHRSIEFLPQALKFSHRAFIFDNSGHSQEWIAEITNGVKLEMRSHLMPVWLQKALKF